MRFQVLAVIAAVAMLAGCETAPEQNAAASGAGGAAPAVTSQTQKVGPVAGSKEDFVVNVGDRVFFAFDKFNLKPEAQATLKKQAAWLQKYQGVTVTIEGNCDERGTREYNLALGERRASAVKDYLAALGVSPSRMKTISYGKERPIALGHDEAAWAQNRNAITDLTSGVPGS